MTNQFVRRIGLSVLIGIAAGWSSTCTADEAQQNEPATSISPEEDAYRKAIAERSEKIVAVLSLDDSAQVDRVVTLVANQYRGLRDIHDARDRALEQIDDTSNGQARDSDRRRTRDKSDDEVVRLHREFVARLGAELSAAQIEHVKDGMTYGVVPITYAAYVELLPALTADEKRHIKACLLEAREYAMDGGSSHEKHGWFGKYKGRINNFLSARGYDLKQAEQDLASRRKAESRDGQLSEENP